MLFVILAYVFFIFLFSDRFTDFRDKKFVFIFPFILSCVVALIVFLSSAIIHHEYGEYQYKDTDNEIVSLDDNSIINGHFILGSGYVSGYNVYNFYQKTDDGGYYRNFVYSNSTIIYEDENNNPYLKKIYKRQVLDMGGWKFWLLLINCNDDWYESKYELHVPENTILKELTLNNK